jgi:antitoxin (DNA-binding transcriptional repressor) of toxin-antitoxin stability system
VLQFQKTLTRAGIPDFVFASNVLDPANAGLEIEIAAETKPAATLAITPSGDSLFSERARVAAPRDVNAGPPCEHWRWPIRIRYQIAGIFSELRLG